MPNSVAEVIVVQPINKPLRLNRAQRRALARATLYHRKQFCPHRCDICGDWIPTYYMNVIVNEKWEKEVRALQKKQQRTKAGWMPLPRHPKDLVCCFDCYTVRREESRHQHQRWCSTHRLHPLERMLRLIAWCGIEVDPALAWRRFLSSSQKEEAVREIEECTAGILDHYPEPEPMHHFAEAMEEMAALELLPPMPQPEDEATEESVALEISVFKLTGESDIVLNDQGWRRLARSVKHCLEAYRRAIPDPQ